MRIQRFELARAIDKVKSIVQKNETKPALSGVLIKDGYLFASNTEITLQVKLEVTGDEAFIVPMKAFDLIKNLPEGEMTITKSDKNIITIQMNKIKNSYQSFPADEFVYYKAVMPDNGFVKLPGKKLMDGLNHVIYAAADKSPNNVKMSGIYFDGKAGALNLVATEGHVIACDRIEMEGCEGIEMIVPKMAIRKILSMGMYDDVEVAHDANAAILRTKEYVIYTRLLDKPYFKYERMFHQGNVMVEVDRAEMAAAMTRAKMCTDDSKPTIFEFSGSNLKIAVRDSLADYEETISVQSRIEAQLRIGFNSRIVLETIKSFTSDSILLSFTSPVNPMMFETEDSNMKSLVLPVKLKG